MMCSLISLNCTALHGHLDINGTVLCCKPHLDMEWVDCLEWLTSILSAGHEYCIMAMNACC